MSHAWLQTSRLRILILSMEQRLKTFRVNATLTMISKQPLHGSDQPGECSNLAQEILLIPQTHVVSLDVVFSHRRGRWYRLNTSKTQSNSNARLIRKHNIPNTKEASRASFRQQNIYHSVDSLRYINLHHPMKQGILISGSGTSTHIQSWGPLLVFSSRLLISGRHVMVFLLHT